jgi:hypothetical protein
MYTGTYNWSFKGKYCHIAQKNRFYKESSGEYGFRTVIYRHLSLSLLICITYPIGTGTYTV